MSESGFYAWRDRPPSERQIRHAWLTDLVTEIHFASRQTYGSIRVHAELKLGQGIDVGRHQVEMVMRRAGLRGIVGRRRRPRIERPDAIALDLVERTFGRGARDELWVTDITEHPTREGKVYCSVVLDAFSRRVVGWSIDASPTAALVTNALGRAIDSRDPRAGTLIHSDQGTQGGIKWSSQHLELEVCDGATTGLGSGGDGEATDAIARPAAGRAAGASTGVLGGDRSGRVERGCRGRGWCVTGGGVAVVP